MKNHITNFIAVFLALVITFNLVACSSKKDNKDTEDITIDLVGTGDTDSPYASDALKTITIKDLNVNEINVVSIDPKDVVVKGINVEEIKSIELQVVPLNDEMVTLAYENFKSVYGEDIDVGKLIANVAVGAVCVIVIVALSTVSGPVGTFFGAVITSEFSALAVVIGAAIDAAISGFQAYQEGGDLAYVLGHMVNGVAEGFMWSAILAPLTGAVAGIKAIRAVSSIRKMPGLTNLTDKQATKLLKNLSKYLKETKNLAGNEADDVIVKVFKTLPKELSDELPQEAFISIVRNKDTLISIALKEDPFGIKGQVVEALRENFWKDLDNVSDDVVYDAIKKIQKGTYKNIDDISSPEVREYIRKNSTEFIDCYSDKFTKDFVENWLKSDIGDRAFNTIKDNIKSADGLVKISKEIGHDALSEILDNAEQYKLLVNRFGSESVEKLRSVDTMYRILKGQSSLGDDQIYKVIDNMFEGGLDITNISESAIVTNLTRYSESVSQLLKNLGLDNKNKELLSELAIRSLSNIEGISDDAAREIISSGMRKSSIISKYGDDVWKRITDNGYSSIACLNIATDADSSLIKEILQDSLSRKGCSDEIIEKIIRGEGYVAWGLSDKEIVVIGNVVSEYYRATDLNLYKNFIYDYADIRGRNIADAVETYAKNNTMNNIKYAGGIMVPAGDNADYILEKYGQIQMSKYGFAIFDEHAVARVVIEDLTGDEAADIARANKIHHGTQQSIPGYTWHHLEDGKTLILIPTELHEAYRHTGGAALIREGLI